MIARKILPLLFILIVGLAFGYISLDKEYYSVNVGKETNISGTITLPEYGKCYTLRIQTDTFTINGADNYTFCADEYYDKKDFSFIIQAPKDLTPGTYYVTLVMEDAEGSVIETDTVKIKVYAPSYYTNPEDLIKVDSQYYVLYTDSELSIPVKIYTKEVGAIYNVVIDTLLEVNQGSYELIPQSENQTFPINIVCKVPTNLKPGKYALTINLYKNGTFLTSRTITVEVKPRNDLTLNVVEEKVSGNEIVIKVDVRNISHITETIKAKVDYSEAKVTPQEFVLLPGKLQTVEIRIPISWNTPESIRFYAQGYTENYVDIKIPRDLYSISVDISTPEEVVLDSSYVKTTIKIKNNKNMYIKGKLRLEDSPDTISLVESPVVELKPFEATTVPIVIHRQADMVPGRYVAKICFLDTLYIGSKECKSISFVVPKVIKYSSEEEFLINRSNEEISYDVKIANIPKGWTYDNDEITINLKPGDKITIKSILDKFNIKPDENAQSGNLVIEIYKDGQLIGNYTEKLEPSKYLPAGQAFLYGSVTIFLIVMISFIIGGLVVYYLFIRKPQDEVQDEEDQQTTAGAKYDIEEHDLAKKLKGSQKNDESEF